MAFSIRNIFQKGAQPEADPGAASGGGGNFPMFNIGGANTATAPNPFGMPSDGAGGTGFGGSIFKARDENEDMQGQPVGARPAGGSPFSPFGAADGVFLTVGDLLAQLPPELVRNGGAALDQPVTISPQALEAALASGSLSVPVFEVYRVCPVLFQVPVSPQDPRMVPLPHSKLVALMSSRGGAPAVQPQFQPQQQPAPGPFGAGMPAGSPFAFGASQAEMSGPPPSPTGGLRPAGALPPRRPAGVPPAIPSQADYAPVPSLQLPGQETAAPQQGGSPFLFQAASSPFAAQELAPPAPPVQSPFGSSTPGPFGDAGSDRQPGNPAHQGLHSMTSLLSSASSPVTDPELTGGPFGGPPASPFGTPAQQPMPGYGAPENASPFGMQAGGSPFAAQVPAVSPFAAQGPMAPPFATQSPTGESPFAASGGESPFASQPQAPQPSPFTFPSSASPFGGPGAGSPFALPSAGGGSPFASSSPAGGSPFGGAAGASPFAMPAAPQEPVQPPSPFAASGVASFEPTPRPTSPEPVKLGAIPFGSPPVQMPAAAPAAATFSLPAMSAPARFAGAGTTRAEENVDISLAAVLKGQTPQDLGFDPNFIPAWINTKLPAALVRQQLPSGQVIIDLGTIIDGTENTFRTVIAHGKREFNVRVPANEIFHLLPPVAPSGSGPLAAAPAPAAAPFLPTMPEASPAFFQPETPAPAATSVTPAGGIIQPLGFQLPFASASTPRVIPVPEQERLVPQAPQPKQPMTSFDPFAANAGDWTGRSQTPNFGPNRAAEIEGGLGSEQLFAPASPPPPPPPPAPVEPPMAVARPVYEQPKAPPAPLPDNDPFAGMADNPFLPSTPPPAAAEFRPAVVSPPLAAFAPVPEFRPLPPAVEQESAPASAPLSAFVPALEIVRPSAPLPAMTSVPTGPSVTLGAVGGDPEQMLLRALLGAADRLDANEVVRMTSQLPGVLATVAVMGGTALTHGGNDKASQDFQSHAAETARSMRSLASLIGFDGAETLSITSGDRLITFTFADALSFGVLHADREPASGLRDKITLIGRELAGLITRSRA